MTRAAAAAPWIAIVGNPNSGKSTLFNRLTGLKQKIANYPGVTVEKKTGTIRLGGRDVTLLDVPGTYSLAAASRDEQIVTDILAERPDAVLCIVDAVNLRRNLFLASQVADLGVPIVVALNMFDLAELQGLNIDVDALSRRLGVPVVPTVATTGRGVDGLRAALERPGRFAPVAWPEPLEAEVRGLGDAPAWSRRRRIFDAGSNGAEAARSRLLEQGIDALTLEPVLRYRHIETLLDGVVTKPDRRKAERAYAIDRILTHRLWGLLIFLAIMTAVFCSLYWAAKPAMDGINAAFAWFGGAADSALASTPVLQSLVVKGIIYGVGAVVVFLPQILILFFFIALLEDTGYMARAAFLMDKVFSWTGLNGKSFVPLLSSYACAVPAIMGTRNIEDPRARLTTILVAPLMSCSARLPVYVLLIGAFIAPLYGDLWAGITLAAFLFLGLLVALPIAFLLNRFLLRMKSVPFVMELPPYRRPRWRDVLLRMFRAGKEFVVRAGTVILILAIIVWALTYFPDGELESSYLADFGRAVQPAFEPAGFDWKITVGVLSSFPAREVILSTMGTIYSREGDDLAAAMAADKWPDGRPVFTPLVAVAIMVFFALCLQCMSTVTMIGREAGWRWAAFAFTYMTALAWAGAVATYQVGTALFG